MWVCVVCVQYRGVERGEEGGDLWESDVGSELRSLSHHQLLQPQRWRLHLSRTVRVAFTHHRALEEQFRKIITWTPKCSQSAETYLGCNIYTRMTLSDNWLRDGAWPKVQRRSLCVDLIKFFFGFYFFLNCVFCLQWDAPCVGTRPPQQEDPPHGVSDGEVKEGHQLHRGERTFIIL